MKHPCRRPAGPEPDISLAESRNAGSTGGKSAIVRQRDRHALDGHRGPGRAVSGRDQRKLAIHRVAQGDAMLAVPESKAVIERFGVFVGELELPAPAAVGRLIDARLLSRPDAQHKSLVCVESLDIAKI